jgi:adenylate cyclase
LTEPEQNATVLSVGHKVKIGNMSNVLWRGDWATRIRIGSGLVLMLYVTLHLMNIAGVLISQDFANAFQDARLAITRSYIGAALLALALIAHLFLTLLKVVMRSTLRMSPVDAIQIGFGIAIPLILSSHIIYTYVAFDAFGVETRIGYLAALIWDTWNGWMQVALMGMTWVHGCIGLHMWLRITPWWQRAIPWMIGLGVLVPMLATVGFVNAGREIKDVLQDADSRASVFEARRFPDAQDFATLARIDQQTDTVIWFILGTLAAILLARRGLATLRRPVRITYIDGPTVRAPRARTLLETSQAVGVPHTALCGGRGRCTTCRVIVEDGLDDLQPPSTAEARSLAAVGAPSNARLACQMRPTGPITIFRVFSQDGERGRAHASQGKEAQLAILFLDMRGFTARTHGQLPYDVVHMLNRFFDAIVPPIIRSGGTVDKYLGDGLMAVFETDTPAQSAKAAINAVQGIAEALDEFNDKLGNEGAAAISIGIGVHLGNVVLGEIGAAGLAPRTLIGDTVNTASRLEGQTKTLGVQVILSKDVLHAAGLDVVRNDMVSLELRGRNTELSSLPIKDARTLHDQLANPAKPEPAAQY